MDEYTDVGTHACWLATINMVLWVSSLVLGKCWPVDFIWSSWPIFHAGWLLHTVVGDCTFKDFLSEPLPWSIFLVVGITAVWGIRLTLNFIRRGGAYNATNAPKKG